MRLETQPRLDLYSAGVADGEIDVELVAASLRASSSDSEDVCRGLAVKLERRFRSGSGGATRRLRFLAKEKRVANRSSASLATVRYSLSTRNGIEARRAKVVRGVVLKSEELSLDGWLDALAHDLAEEAQTSERAQLALQELLSG